MDAVEYFSAQWAAERPGTDVEPIAAWGRLKRTANLFDRALAQVLDRFDLNLAEFEVLAALSRTGTPYEMRPTELTRSLIITPGAVTARLATLEKRGFIARRRHGKDGRVQLVTLSAKGFHVFHPAFDAILEKCAEMLDAMDEEDRHNLHTSLKALMDPMDSFDLPRGAAPDTEPEPAA
jgi:DNA-binding MarR family transcriptional regulator